ncbi:MAG: alpha-glucan family phosphorylase [Chloroflexi bacterium]|nr:alpha-glucan family phosphorylase [Chloroflexota bacterium]
MSNGTMAEKLFPFFLRNLPDEMEVLVDMATDLRWTWSHAGNEVWRRLDPEIWERTGNPLLIMQNVTLERFEQLQGDKEFKKEMERLVEERKEYFKHPRWYRENFPEATNPVVYISPEFGVGEALPLYAGGLGILAGDYLKTASDLGVPMVGIGLLYQEGYFRQILNEEGWQVEAYPYNDPTGLPIRPALDLSGGWLRVTLDLPGRKLFLRVWEVTVGAVTLYLLDSNDALNSPSDRGITSKLYDERLEIRLVQEMALGIGGWRIVDALGLNAEVCHFNEGHAAFVVLERARAFMKERELSFPVSLCATRAGNVFTTHTPVAAGFITFPPALMARYFRKYSESLGISMVELLALGRLHWGDAEEPFSMALLAARGSININGVSRLHGEVSRRIFQPLFPRWPEHEVPVCHITNGVHVPSWDSDEADKLWTQARGETCWLDPVEDLTSAVQQLGDREIWEFRGRGRRALVDYVRRRLFRQLQQYGLDPEIAEEAQHALDLNALTLGFARRFTAYKRPNLILHDASRLLKILTNRERPVQLVVAGKAHPQDEQGKKIIQQLMRFANQSEICRRHVVFLDDYDMALAKHLVQGIDVWINTPRRPWEACGTSGMKVLVNGGLNFSELDGWWAEAYTPEVGWALGDGREHISPEWDALEAEHLYEVLEKEIIPEFYEGDSQGIPRRWVQRVRASMAELTPRFSTTRMLHEYVKRVYQPATARFRQRTANHAGLARELTDWLNATDHYWGQIHFGQLQVERKDGALDFTVAVYLGEMDSGYVRVEAYADPLDGQPAVVQALEKVEQLQGVLNGFLFRGSVKTERPQEHFSLRIIPAHPEAQAPLENNNILWHR